MVLHSFAKAGLMALLITGGAMMTAEIVIQISEHNQSKNIEELAVVQEQVERKYADKNADGVVSDKEKFNLYSDIAEKNGWGYSKRGYWGPLLETMEGSFIKRNDNGVTVFTDVGEMVEWFKNYTPK